MPKILTRLIKQLKASGKTDIEANRIAVAALQKSGNLKKGTRIATKKGIKRGNMTPAQRAKDRASKSSGRPISDFKYNRKTNRATLKKKK